MCRFACTHSGRWEVATSGELSAKKPKQHRHKFGYSTGESELGNNQLPNRVVLRPCVRTEFLGFNRGVFRLHEFFKYINDEYPPPRFSTVDIDCGSRERPRRPRFSRGDTHETVAICKRLPTSSCIRRQADAKFFSVCSPAGVVLRAVAIGASSPNEMQRSPRSMREITGVATRPQDPDPAERAPPPCADVHCSQKCRTVLFRSCLASLHDTRTVSVVNVACVEFKVAFLLPVEAA